jgi:uncharacterized protein
MKTLFVCGAVVFLLFTSVACADEASKKVTAEELLAVTKADQMTTPILKQARSFLEQQFAQTAAAEDMKPILKSSLDKLFAVIQEIMSWQTLKEDMIAIYVQAFTEDELKGMLEFYKSPTGQSVIDKLPTVMQASMALLQKRIPQLQPKVKQISDEMVQEVKTEMERRKTGQR